MRFFKEKLLSQKTGPFFIDKYPDGFSVRTPKTTAFAAINSIATIMSAVTKHDVTETSSEESTDDSSDENTSIADTTEIPNNNQKAAQIINEKITNISTFLEHIKSTVENDKFTDEMKESMIKFSYQGLIESINTLDEISIDDKKSYRAAEALYDILHIIDISIPGPMTIGTLKGLGFEPERLSELTKMKSDIGEINKNLATKIMQNPHFKSQESSLSDNTPADLGARFSFNPFKK